MGIKNWTVTAESVKNVYSREIYFHDAEHKNHINTDAILNICGDAKTSGNIIANCERRKMELAKNGKGGRPPTPAMEFVLTLPKGMRPSEKEWRTMMLGICGDMADTMQIAKTELNNIVRAVVHQQNQDEAKRGAGDHMHMMVGKFTDSGIFLKPLQQRAVLQTIKLSFNEQVKKVMGIDHAEYTSNKNYKGVAKKKAPQWKVKQARREDELEIQEHTLEQRDREISKREMSAEIIIPKFADNLAKLANHLEKYNQAKLEGNEKGQARQLNRMGGVIGATRELEVDGIEYPEELKNASRVLNKQLDEINKDVEPEKRLNLLKVSRPIKP